MSLKPLKWENIFAKYFFREKCFERFFRNIFREKNFVKKHFAKRAFRSNVSKNFSKKSFESFFANCFEIVKIFEKIFD